ncbi:hypothetical protein ACFLTS_07520, partial [Chloroflexota bacterium]
SYNEQNTNLTSGLNGWGRSTPLGRRKLITYSIPCILATDAPNQQILSWNIHYAILVSENMGGKCLRGYTIVT